MPWYVLYTNPRAEKKAAEQLTKMGIVNYCPMVVKVSQWSDRKKKIEVPLFSSYVFVNIEEKDRNEVFNVKGIVRYLFWLGNPAVIKEHEIDTIKHWLRNTDAVIEVENIKAGSKVTIPDGPFKDQSGIVQDVNKNTVRLLLETMGIVLTMRLAH